MQAHKNSRQIGSFTTQRGKSLPFGAEELKDGVNFALYSENATAVWLVLFLHEETKPAADIQLDEDINRTGNVWHILVNGVDSSIRYAWRVDGPQDEQNLHLFDPDNLLLDPYARVIPGGSVWGKPDVKYIDMEGCDKICHHWLSGMVQGNFDWQGDVPPRTALKDTIIYEINIRSFTRHSSSETRHPGTYLGLIEKIPYLKSLGITAVELLPVFEFDENENLRHHPGTGELLLNLWGYSPIAFFAPKSSYASDNSNGNEVNEFREMVKAFHQAGIEVFLDVVYNHTGEGDKRGPTISLKGIDNSIYYILDDQGQYKNYTGCGNTLNCNHPQVRDMIIESLRYWVSEMHVDGFRFDLASILGRGPEGEVLQDPPLITRIANDPVLADAKIIAEAWDAAGLYQVGSFPSWGRWAEWNGLYRDQVRMFWKGEKGIVSKVATRLCGSDDLYMMTGDWPFNSINYVTAHDGFTLSDLVSYENKHNEDNGEDNRDGDNNNHSMNFGVEGPTDDPEINRLRMRMMKNYMATLLLSQGIPMILGGDEFCRTQQGNNNAYCQDNEVSWVNWEFAEMHKEMHRFTKMMVAFRKHHANLRREQFFVGSDIIHWHGEKAGKPDWSENTQWVAYHLERTTEPEWEDDDIFVILNASDHVRGFEIPDVGRSWHRVIDTAKPSPEDIFYNEKKAPELGRYIKRLEAAPRSVIVLVGL